ncbi:MAG: MotA/TolQ/ExbB proton channel family protein [Oligoflexales bacterium]
MFNSGSHRFVGLFILFFAIFVSAQKVYAADKEPPASTVTDSEASTGEASSMVETEGEANSIFLRAWQGGFVVFLVLFVLVCCSVFSWSLVVAKYLSLRKLADLNDSFIKSFWESRSLNELNGKLGDFPRSPAKEVFRAGYAELVKGSSLKDHTPTTQLAVNAALDNLGRTLTKAKNSEKNQMERYLAILATMASACPFVGLFGTVWGIMGAFEGIARTGSASLAAVAPGISEALIATAFGLAAAIPAAVGYNMATHKIKMLLSLTDGFVADFLNIVERYLVSDKSKGHTPATGL